MTAPNDRARELAALSPDLTLGSNVRPPRRCPVCTDIVKHDEESPYCRPECQSNAEEDHAQKTLRALAFGRDNGKCFSCQADTEAERVEIEQMREWIKTATTSEHVHFAKNRLAYYRDQRGYLDTEIAGEKSLHEAHHLVERAKGGPNTLANIRTACSPCHARLTGDFSRSRKVARKPRGRFGR